MKKILAMICAFIVCFLFGGCNKKEADNNSEPVNSDTTSSEQSDSAVNVPDLENMTPEELEEYFSEFHFDFDEPIVLPDDE